MSNAAVDRARGRLTPGSIPFGLIFLHRDFFADFVGKRGVQTYHRESRKMAMRASTIDAQFVRLLGATLVLGIASFLQPATESNAFAAEPPEQIEGGLVRVEKAKLDHVYLLPGASFAQYDQLRIDPVDVSFSPNWKPNEGTRSLTQKLTKEDIEKIRITVAEEFQKYFKKELSDAGYSIVDHDGPGVLRLTPRIVNLYITAPDKPSAGRTRTYTTSTGHLTLDLALRDSATGQYLARAVDTVQGLNSAGFRMEVTNRVTNLGTARMAFSKWARALREGLEEARQAANTQSSTKFAEGATPR